MIVSSTARLRFSSIPPRKMRRVVELVRGLAVEQALNVLNFTPKAAALPLAKTVKSAAANAMTKEGADRLRPESLVIKRILVDEAPSAKRIRYQSMGRVFRYKKRFCHLLVELEGQLDAPTAVKARGAKAKVKAEAAPVAGATETVEKPKTKSRKKKAADTESAEEA